MSGAHASAPAVTYALAHALWQVALLAGGYALATRWLRAPAQRHVLGMAAMVVGVVAPLVTFAGYRAPGPARGPLPTMIGGVDWLALVVPSVWLVGVAIVVARQLVDGREVRALRRLGAAPGAWVLRLDALRGRLGIARPIAVRVQQGAPFTAFAWRPTVWLPADWEALPEAQRDALALHELAHVRRLDWIWNGVQRALEAALWFHPAARWLGRRLRQEREHACDDAAVAACEPVVLVEALVALERGARASVLAAGGGELVERSRRLLGEASATRVPIVAVVTLGLGALVASQLALPHDMLLGLRVDASTRGALTPGTYRDIATDAFLDQRHYRGTMDERGALHERYEENGEPRPIDGAVRAWLDELVAIDAR